MRSFELPAWLAPAFMICVIISSMSWLIAHNNQVAIAGGWAPTEIILYFDESSFPDSVSRAEAAWGRVDGVARFRETGNLDEAEVIIQDMSIDESEEYCPSGCSGQVDHIGKIPGTPTILKIAVTSKADPTLVKVKTVSHEFGHILGLTHSKEKCALMSTESICPNFVYTRGQDYYALCGPLMADVARIDGASMRPGREWCQSNGPDRYLLGLQLDGYLYVKRRVDRGSDPEDVFRGTAIGYVEELLDDEGALPGLQEWGISKIPRGVY